MSPDDARDPSPDFGPSGYLPERASKRARKIVLRAPLGLQWILAAAVFGLVVVVAGVYWLQSSGPPGPPYEDVGPLEAFTDEVVHVDVVDAWIVTAGPLLVVPGSAVDDLRWCEASGRLEDGTAAWDLSGRGLGVPSLPAHPAVVQDGRVYVDPTRTRQGPRVATRVTPPACTD